MVTLTFIIPVRHPHNASNWPRLKANLTQTMRSIAAQTNADWRGVVVANRGADLPPLARGFDAVWVDFPPNRLHERGDATQDQFYEAFRIDKGQRVLAGMLACRDSRFFMIADDDDFVSRRLVDYAAAHPDANGWKITQGFVWGDGGAWLYRHDSFSDFCGTSLIVRSDLYGLPDRFEDAGPDFITSMLGSHTQIAAILAGRDTPLAALPFAGAVYRVGHPGAHSASSGLASMYFPRSKLRRDPIGFLDNLRHLRPLTTARRAEFFGSA